MLSIDPRFHVKQLKYRVLLCPRRLLDCPDFRREVSRSTTTYIIIIQWRFIYVINNLYIRIFYEHMYICISAWSKYYTKSLLFTKTRIFSWYISDISWALKSHAYQVMLVHTSQHITMYVLAFIYDVYSDFFLCLLNEYAVTMTSTSVFWSMCLTSCVTLIVHDGLLGKKILVFRPSSSLFEFLKKQESNLLTKCLLRKHIHYMCFFGTSTLSRHG